MYNYHTTIIQPYMYNYHTTIIQPIYNRHITTIHGLLMFDLGRFG